LYYLNNAVVSLEHNDFDLVLDSTDHWCRFDITHNSTFLVSGTKLKNPDISKAKAKLTNISYSYNGKEKKPGVSIYGLKKGRDYTVSYQSNIKIGVGKVIIKGKGNYRGTLISTFKITPKKTFLSSVKSSKSKTMVVQWKKDSMVTGYEVQYSTNKSFKYGVKKVTVTRNSITSKTITRLIGRVNYYIRIRSYKTVAGKKLYGEYSSVKGVNVK
jgi:hypothetical protein